MSTSKDTVSFILGKLRNAPRFSVRAMFGEYAIYADGKVVGLICQDTLYIKITPESGALDGMCEKDAPYPGAKPYYVISEEQIHEFAFLPSLLFNVASRIPAKKAVTRKK